MNNILNIIKNQIPLIDLRAPVEYKKGAFPTSKNIPILNNKERSQVGLTYKKNGQKAAIELGFNFVKNSKINRVQLWNKFIKKYPETHLYCMRGGLRSLIAKSWLYELGVDAKIINGGYKKLRQTVLKIINSVDNKDEKKQWIILAGKTGSGKTTILKKFKSAIDLEALANHRGSAFGKLQTDQPTIINFENNLAFKYLNHNYCTLFLEDESRRIGKILIPEIWYQKMKLSKIIIVDIPIEERIYNIKKEYVHKPLNNGISRLRLNTLFQSSLLNIRKRLGIKNYDEISKIIQNVVNKKSISSHEDWIKKLLINYYDPMYNYQLSSKTDLCIFKSNKSETIKFMKGLELKKEN